MFSLNLLKFEDIREQIVKYLSENSEYSGTFDFSGSNISYVVKTMSYIGMMLSYLNANRSNNDLLDTTTIRSNAVSLAKNIGYRPKRVQSALISGRMMYKDGVTEFDTNSFVKISPKSVFMSDTGNTYVNQDEIILLVDPNDNKSLVGEFILTEGFYSTFSFSGSGVPLQSITIPNSQIEENSLELYVKGNTESGIGIKWDEVKNIFNIVKDNIFFVEEDITKKGCPKLVFGNGIIGKIPANNEIVTVKFLVSNAEAANGDVLTSLPEAACFTTSSDVSFNISFVSEWQSASPAYGGTSLEELKEIQHNAPRSFATAGRAVTQPDYTTFLNQYPYILNGNAIGGEVLFPNDSTKLGNTYIAALPKIDKKNFRNNSVIYLNTLQENTFINDIRKSNIMATKIKFLKPSYIYLDITPSVEYAQGISTSEQILVSAAVSSAFSKHVDTYFNDFDPSFRASKINSLITNTTNVKSSDITINYYFIINENSFYELNNSDLNIIFLPVKSESYDPLGQVYKYTNFVRTNLEQKLLLTGSKTGFIPNSEKTIYGPIKNDTPSVRSMYNEDLLFTDSNGNLTTESCEIKIDGANLFFSVYRFDQNLDSNITSNVKNLITVSSSAVSGLDMYTITSKDFGDIPSTLIGTIKRSKSNHNKGVISNELNFTPSPSGGEYYEVVSPFDVEGADKHFTSVEKDDYVIFDNSIGKWIKTEDYKLAKHISALSGTLHSNEIAANSIFTVAVSGDAEGRFTSTVKSGERVIYNSASLTNPLYNWEKMPDLPISTIPASGVFPIQAQPYDLKLVTIENSNFGGRTNSFNVNDLIFYKPSVVNPTDRWELICNIDDTSTIPSISAADPSVLFNFQYTGIGGTPIGEGIVGNNFIVGIDPLPIGTTYKINEIGSFLYNDMIIWPTEDVEDHVAWINDIIVYVGLSEINGITKARWKLFSNSMANLFEVDGSDIHSLPYEMQYGDFFNVSGSGDFNSQSTFSVVDGDQIVFLGDNNWKKLVTENLLIDASSVSGLPPSATLGQIFYISEDGNFNNSNLVYPLNENFVQGDYIIFTGSTWSKLREYTFEYNRDVNLPNPYSEIGKNLLNSLTFNSKFYYNYNYVTKNYDFYFDDVYHNCRIGIFTYNSSTSKNNDVGKISFNKTVVGKFNDNAPTTEVTVKSLFSYSGTGENMNLIRILPKNKIDSEGVLTLEPETDFDTVYNQFIIPVLKPIG